MPRYVIDFTGDQGKKRIAYIKAIHNLRETTEFQITPNTDGTITVETPDYSQPEDREGISFIDLKPYFATGAHVKQNKTKPGWHTVVPIQPSNKQLSNINPELTSPLNFKITDFRPTQTIQDSHLKLLSNNYITQNRWAFNKLFDKGSYNISGGHKWDPNQPDDFDDHTMARTNTLFRTVSNNSPAISWITQINNRANNDQGLTKHITINADSITPEDSEDIQHTLLHTPQAKAKITNTVKDYLNKQSYNLGNNIQSKPQNYQENLFNQPNIPFNNLNDINR